MSMYRSRINLLILFITFSNALVGQRSNKCEFELDKDASGQLSTIQASINAGPYRRKNETTIFMKKGTYKEKRVVAKSKNAGRIIGEHVDSVILTYDDHASKKNIFGE